jgi:hypothetical protein
LHIVENRQAPAAQQFIGKYVDYKFNSPENIGLGAEPTLKKDYRAFRPIPVGAIQIPEAN